MKYFRKRKIIIQLPIINPSEKAIPTSAIAADLLFFYIFK